MHGLLMGELALRCLGFRGPRYKIAVSAALAEVTVAVLGVL